MSDALAAEVLARLGRVLPPDDGPYPLHEPAIGGNAWAYVKDCLDTGWVSSVGGYVDRFEAAVYGTDPCRVPRSRRSRHTGPARVPAARRRRARRARCWRRTRSSLAYGQRSFDYCGPVPHVVAAETTSLCVDAAALEAYLGAIASDRATVIASIAGPDGGSAPRSGMGIAADTDARPGRPGGGEPTRSAWLLIADGRGGPDARADRGAQVVTGRLAALNFNDIAIVTTVAEMVPS